MTISRTDSSLLFRVLLANALFSGISGLILLFAAGAVSRLIGFENPQLLMALGAGLLVFSFLLARHVRRQRIGRTEAIAISIMDLGWVLASAGLLLLYPDLFSPAGVVAIIAVAVIVLVFFELQALALWKTRQKPTT